MPKKKDWLRVRNQWLKEHPPNHQGYYICYICEKWIPKNEVTLDHVKSRSRYPELGLDINNLQPCCYSCNMQKGSL